MLPAWYLKSHHALHKLASVTNMDVSLLMSVSSHKDSSNTLPPPPPRKLARIACTVISSVLEKTLRVPFQIVKLGLNVNKIMYNNIQ